MAVANESIYNCYSSYGCGCVNKPIDSEIVSPYVKLTFLSSEKSITVGNIPSPGSKNLASIKSFQYGSSDGVGAEVEIYDEEGGDFQFFVDKIVKNPSKALDLYKAVCQWGWITKNCNGVTSTILSKCHVFAILSVDISISGAKGIIFKVELFDLMVSLFETQVTKVFNNTLKQNIKDLFATTNPPLTDVRFKRHRQNNALAAVVGGLSTSGCSFSIADSDLDDMKLMGGSEDTKIKCDGNNLTPLAAAKTWISQHRTDRNKAIIVFYNNIVDCTKGNVIPSVIFLEDPLPICYDQATVCSNSIGTYIVNGGKDSSVISFEPKIRFNFSAAAHDSVVVGNETVKSARSSGQPCDDDGGGSKKLEGAAAMVQATAALVKLFGPQGAVIAGLQANVAAERANKTYEAVEAELKIQGEPRLDDPFAIKVKTVSVIVVNPFRLDGNHNDGSSCPIWLTSSPCNKILSNKSWFINGVFHEISGGSYTTTLKLFLPSPGTTITI